MGLHPAPCNLHPAPCTLYPEPCILHPAPSRVGLEVSVSGAHRATEGGGEMSVKGTRVRSYRGTSLIRNPHPVGSYSRTMPRALWGS